MQRRYGPAQKGASEFNWKGSFRALARHGIMTSATWLKNPTVAARSLQVKAGSVSDGLVKVFSEPCETGKTRLIRSVTLYIRLHRTRETS